MTRPEPTVLMTSYTVSRIARRHACAAF